MQPSNERTYPQIAHWVTSQGWIEKRGHPVPAIDPSPGARGAGLLLSLPARLTCATMVTSLATGSHHTLFYAGSLRAFPPQIACWRISLG
jgi:hypothetical protein